jgi:glycosyltransferase involved in cell wall biosynthesis
MARVKCRNRFKVVILSGDSFANYASDVRMLGLEDRILVLERVKEIEDYLQIADITLQTSETESFCLSILEAMCFATPAVSTSVGGIPEVVQDGVTGILVPFGDADALARAVEDLVDNPERRVALGRAAQRRAQESFSPDAIVPLYEDLYRRTCAAKR